jgi:hypothetical protein
MDLRCSSHPIRPPAMPSRSFDAEAYPRALERPQRAESERQDPPKRLEEAAVGSPANELAAWPGCSPRALARSRARPPVLRRSPYRCALGRAAAPASHRRSTALPAFPRSPKMYGSGWAAKASMGAWSGTGVGASLHRSAVSFSQHADEDAPKRPIPRAVD